MALQLQASGRPPTSLTPVDSEVPDDPAAHRGRFATHEQLPEAGIGSDDILSEMRSIAAEEGERWRQGYVSGAVYHGDAEHTELLTHVYALHSQSNPLHADVWPSASKYEAEIVSMTANLLGASARAPGSNTRVCGTVTSGGTESILLAMKAYRDYARERHGITEPEIVAAETAHTAFDKAAQYFGIRRINVPIDSGIAPTRRRCERPSRKTRSH